MGHLSIEEKNQIISIFDGMTTYGEDDPYFEKNGFLFLKQDLIYRNQWEWLMPVVSKIETIESGRFGFTDDPWSIVIIDYSDDHEIEIINISKEWEKGIDRNDYLRECYFEAIARFIEWYKSKKT